MNKQVLSLSWIERLSVAAVIIMLGTIPLAWFSLPAGPVPHAAVGVVGSIISILLHVRRAGGADLGASLLLGLGAMLGFGVPDGAMGAEVHAVVAKAGVAFSAWVHVGQLRGTARSPRPAPGPSASF